MAADWSAGWPDRANARARSLGYKSLTQFAQAHDRATFSELAGLLDVDLAPIQVEKALRLEAVRARTLNEFARSCLARTLHARLPGGWNQGSSESFQRARVYAGWTTALGSEHDERADIVWRALQEAIVPEGWLPSGANDPILLKVFEGVSFDDAESAALAPGKVAERATVPEDLANARESGTPVDVHARSDRSSTHNRQPSVRSPRRSASRRRPPR